MNQHPGTGTGTGGRTSPGRMIEAEFRSLHQRPAASAHEHAGDRRRHSAPIAPSLEVRAGRVGMVRDFATVTPDGLAAARKNPWAPEHQETTLSCVHVNPRVSLGQSRCTN